MGRAELLEVVHVDEEDAEALVEPLGALHLFRQPAVEIRIRIDLGQRVHHDKLAAELPDALAVDGERSERRDELQELEVVLGERGGGLAFREDQSERPGVDFEPHADETHGGVFERELGELGPQGIDPVVEEVRPGPQDLGQDGGADGFLEVAHERLGKPGARADRQEFRVLRPEEERDAPAREHLPGGGHDGLEQPADLGGGGRFAAQGGAATGPSYRPCRRQV